jgi:membrane protease YdiL (CAAX protease family)
MLIETTGATMTDQSEPLHPFTASDAFAPLPPTPRHNAFIGRFGLRAGWSIAIFALLFSLLVSLFTFAALAASGKLKQQIAHRQSTTAPKAAAPAPPMDFKPKTVVLNEGFAFAAVALASVILAIIERRRMAVYGINRRDLLDFLPGAFWGLASLSLLILALRACHVLVFDSRLLYGTAMYLYGAKWLLAFLLVGLLEEYLTRGFLQYTLMRGLYGLAEKLSPANARAVAFWLAAAVMSLLFGAGHLANIGESPMGLVMVVCAGVLFSYALWRTGSLWWAIGFHMAWDWAQSFLYGVPDSGNISAGRLFQTHPTGSLLLSGGADGPEGSVLVLPTLLLVALVIRFTTSQRPQPPIEQEPLIAATVPAIA